MSNLKLVLWNLEWLNDLFVSDSQVTQFRPDTERTQHSKDSTVKQRRDDLSGVLRELSPDMVIVVEGPSRPEELRLFFDQIGFGTWVTYLQVSSGQQNIGVAVRTDANKFLCPPLTPWDTRSDRRFDSFLIDTDDDEIKEQYGFERRPLYVEICPSEGVSFRVLGLHLKSKGIFSAYEWSKWWSMADANCKKILAEATQIRQSFLDAYLLDDQTRQIPLIVGGDLNAGPGLDASEKRLFGSGVERLMGNVWKPDLCLGNALFDTLKPEVQEQLDFSALYTTSYRDPIFDNTYQHDWIDHILYSRCQLDHWVRHSQLHRPMPDGTPIWEKYKHASDHFPLSVEIDTSAA